MAKRRSRRGAFDPDYRTKGWRSSNFTPARSNLSITQLALAIAFMVFLAFFIIPATAPMMKTTQGIIQAGIFAFALFIGLAVIIRLLVWRTIRPKDRED